MASWSSSRPPSHSAGGRRARELRTTAPDDSASGAAGTFPRVTREAFRKELELLRESLLRMGGLVESQIDDALTALRTFDRAAADRVRRNDQPINELFRQLREQVFQVIATQQPVARDLRTLMGVQFVAIELERLGDYAVQFARPTSTLAGLPHGPLRPELGLMGELASQQVRDILDALIEED